MLRVSVVSQAFEMSHTPFRAHNSDKQNCLYLGIFILIKPERQKDGFPVPVRTGAD